MIMSRAVFIISEKMICRQFLIILDEPRIAVGTGDDGRLTDGQGSSRHHKAKAVLLANSLQHLLARKGFQRFVQGHLHIGGFFVRPGPCGGACGDLLQVGCCHIGRLPTRYQNAPIFQSLQGNSMNPIKKILLTASGGPFRGRKLSELEGIRVEDALKHPNWSMGQKITIDSSTMVNKGLEVIEAKWLFDVDLSQIQVVVHPQSVIHSAVEYADGAVIAQLGTPDMRIPIQYALYYPSRPALSGDRLDLFKLKDLTFEAPDLDTFKGLALAMKAARAGGNIPTAFNAANERAVALFLNKKIKYLEIIDIIEACMENASFIENPSVDEILDTEQCAYDYISKRW